jgi:hypothetical protein
MARNQSGRSYFGQTVEPDVGDIIRRSVRKTMLTALGSVLVACSGVFLIGVCLHVLAGLLGLIGMKMKDSPTAVVVVGTGVGVFGLFLFAVGTIMVFYYGKLLLRGERLILGGRFFQSLSKEKEAQFQLPWDNIGTIELRVVDTEYVRREFIIIDLIAPDRADTILDPEATRNDFQSHVALRDHYEIPLRDLYTELRDRWMAVRYTAPPAGEPDPQSLARERLSRKRRKSTGPLRVMLLLVFVAGGLSLGLCCFVGFAWYMQASKNADKPSSPGAEVKPRETIPKLPVPKPTDTKSSGPGGTGPWMPRPPKLEAVPAAPTQYAGLVGYRPLDEGNGTRTADTVKGATAEMVGGLWIDGVRGKAVLFDGKADYIDLGEGMQLNFADRAPFSLSLWVATQQGAGTFFSMRNAGNGGPVVCLAVAGKALLVTLRSDGPEFGEVRASGGVLNDGEWHHVALVRGPDGIVAVYVDGQRIGQLKGDRAAGALTTNLRALGSERYLAIKGGFGPAYFGGAVDDLAIYDRALIEQEVKELAGRR